MKLQHDLILRKAKEKGYKVTDLSSTLNTFAALIEYNDQSELIYEGTPLSLINLRSLRYFDNKQLTKLALAKLDVPHPKSMLFQDPKEESISSFLDTNKKYVCKPPDMSEGVGVEMNFTQLQEIEDYWQRNQHLGNTFMLEEQVEGEDLRMQVIGGKIKAACTREPAFVIGDGENNIEKLVENRRIIIKSQNPSNDLKIDKTTLKLLENQHLQLSDIPSKGKKIILKELANMSQGAVAIDMMHSLHPCYQEWVDKIVAYLKVDFFAIDFITKSFDKDPLTNTIVLEINAQPEWLHHTFSEGLQHDIAGMILQDLFENKK